jgi:hypothetical protein
MNESNSPFTEGYNAYFRDKFAVCPHEKDSPNWLEWWDGWGTAEEKASMLGDDGHELERREPDEASL